MPRPLDPLYAFDRILFDDAMFTAVFSRDRENRHDKIRGPAPALCGNLVAQAGDKLRCHFRKRHLIERREDLNDLAVSGLC
jgi:hypothetical protein